MRNRLDFRNKVFQAVRKIPRGEVATYKELAEKADSPLAWRAVGNILNKNRDPGVSCHRVICSNGKVGGYREGTNKKTSLLRKEGMVIKNQRVILQKRRKEN